MSETWNGRTGIKRGDAWAEKWRNDAVEADGSPETRVFLKDTLKYKDAELAKLAKVAWVYKAKVVPAKKDGDDSEDNLDKADLTVNSYRKPDCESSPMCGSSNSCIDPKWYSHKDLKHMIAYPNSTMTMSCTTFDKLKKTPSDEDMKNDLCITHAGGATNYPTDSCNGSLSIDLDRGKCAVYINGESRPLDSAGGSETSDTNPFAPTSPENSWPANSD